MANGLVNVGSNGGIIAATTNTTFIQAQQIQLNGNSLQIGYNGSVDGFAKLAPSNTTGGTTTIVQLAAGNLGSAGSSVTVLAGNMLQLTAVGEIPQLAGLTVNGVLDINNVDWMVGPLAGSGIINNTNNAAHNLAVGYGGQSGTSTTFSGLFSSTQGAGADITITKIGASDLTLQPGNPANLIPGTAAATTAFTINQGSVTYSGSQPYTYSFGSYVVNEGGSLNLDNSSVGVSGRLNTKPVTLGGATFNFTGNGSATETTGASLTLTQGQSAINMLGGNGGTITLGSGGSLVANAGSTFVVSGSGLGTTQQVLMGAAPTLIPAGTGIFPRHRGQRLHHL